MTAVIIRPAVFSTDPEVVGPVHRMRVANANAANNFHAVEEGLAAVSGQAARDTDRADRLTHLSQDLGRQMRVLLDETRRFTAVLRAE